ncbi:MAG: MFS transporter [Planctomycetia bacterium]
MTHDTHRPPRHLPRVASYTLQRQLPAEVLLGVFGGVFGLGGFALRRSLGAPELLVPLVLALGQLPWALAPSWQPLFGSMDRRRAFVVLGWMSKGPLLLVAFVSVVATGGAGMGQGDYVLFLILLVLFYVGDSAYIPHRAALIGSNYPAHVRGRMFGLLAMAAMLAQVAASKASGWVLDHDPRSLRWLFPLAAALGIAGHVVLSRIAWRAPPMPATPGVRGLKAAGRAVARTWHDTRDVLRADPAFRRYELGFMLYGFGLNMSMSVLLLYSEGSLKVSYADWTTAQGVANPLAYLLSVALLGRLVDRLGVVRLTMGSFALLSTYFLLLPLVDSLGGLVLTYILFGISMAGVVLGWNLGPLHFAPPQRAHQYMSVHVALVAFRSTLAPLAGFVVYRLLDAPSTFLCSAALVLAAVLVMQRLDRHVRRQERMARLPDIPTEQAAGA